jgi:hypothetical protein
VCDAYAKKETINALLVNIDGITIWIPKSQIDKESDVKISGDSGTLIFTRSVAKQQGLI